MPVTLPRENYEFWLDPDMREAEPLLDLSRPYSEDEMEAYPVSRFVNRPSNDDERCVESVA
jgi:putative SOS response-associated peptidase YedK